MCIRDSLKTDAVEDGIFAEGFRDLAELDVRLVHGFMHFQMLRGSVSLRYFTSPTRSSDFNSSRVFRLRKIALENPLRFNSSSSSARVWTAAKSESIRFRLASKAASAASANSRR